MTANRNLKRRVRARAAKTGESYAAALRESVAVIGKITAPGGQRVEGLIYYLFGPARPEEHTDPRIVAGWRHPAELEPPLRPDSHRDFRRLLGC